MMKRTKIRITLFICLIEAVSLLTEEVVKCDCDACRERVRRVLVRQMTLFHMFVESTIGIRDLSCKVYLHGGPSSLPITEWVNNPGGYVQLCMQDPVGFADMLVEGSRFRGQIGEVIDFIFS